MHTSQSTITFGEHLWLNKCNNVRLSGDQNLGHRSSDSHNVYPLAKLDGGHLLITSGFSRLLRALFNISTLIQPNPLSCLLWRPLVPMIHLIFYTWEVYEAKTALCVVRMTFDQKFPYCSSLSTIFRPETFSRTHERMDDCQLLSSRMVWGRIVIVIRCRIIARAKGLRCISAADIVFFQIKNYTKGEKLGCQNVIMLITDGAPDYYKEIFQLYNPDKKVYNK